MGNALDPGDEAHRPDLRPHWNSRELAITYPDGYPLGGHASPEAGFNADCDSVLRRFITIGHIMMLLRNTWEKTGHVLVLDADSGWRRCHPWIVLASEWEIEDQAAAILGEETWITAPKSIGRNVTDTPGVLPSDRNRTAIAKIMPCDDSIKLTGGKLVEHFGPDFRFYLSRVGNESLGDSPEPLRGPSRAEIMQWYWDPIKEKEVCYTSTGQLWYEYDPATGEYNGAYPLPSGQYGNWLEADECKGSAEARELLPSGQRAATFTKSASTSSPASG
ncbi:hypothetical protein G7Y79_00053g087980 [Physcia stellaris]|nr:hypothetical protein G7Y79_00053g087980 [Physcia stellaris]